MPSLTSQEIDRIYEVTDSLDLHRNWVAVPLRALPTGRETQLPDGRILIEAPHGEPFEPWLEGLRRRLESLDLRRTPRQVQQDPPLVNTPEAPQMGSGSRRYLPLTGPLFRACTGGGDPPRCTA